MQKGTFLKYINFSKKRFGWRRQNVLVWRRGELDILSTFESSRSAGKLNCGVSGSDGLQNIQGAIRSYIECGGNALPGTLALQERYSYPVSMTKMSIVHSLYLCSNPSSKISISPSNLSIHLPVCSCPFKSPLLSFANSTVAVPA